MKNLFYLMYCIFYIILFLKLIVKTRVHRNQRNIKLFLRKCYFLQFWDSVDLTSSLVFSQELLHFTTIVSNLTEFSVFYIYSKFKELKLKFKFMYRLAISIKSYLSYLKTWLADIRKILIDQCNSEILETKSYEKTRQRIKAYHISMMSMLCVTKHT